MAEEKEINTSEEPITEGQNVSPPGGEETDSDTVSKVVESSEKNVASALNTALKKNFSNDEEALKSVKDTFSYVGKVGKLLPVVEQLQNKGMKEEQVIGVLEGLMKEEETTENTPTSDEQIDTSKFVSRDEFEESTFYSQKPEFEPYKGVIKALKGQNPDKSLTEVVELDEFKSLYEKAHAHEEAEKSKSVLETNSRLGQVKDKLGSAKEAQAEGNSQKAETDAVSAVVDAFLSE